jgi:hypothetical protein
VARDEEIEERSNGYSRKNSNHVIANAEIDVETEVEIDAGNTEH